MEESDESIWNSLLNIYNKTKSEQTLQNLSCVKTRKLLTKYLTLIMKNDSDVPNHQFLDVISFANAKDPELTFDFIIANLGKIKDKYESFYKQCSLNVNQSNFH